MPMRLKTFAPSVTLFALFSGFSIAQTPGSVNDHVLGEQTKRLPKHFADGSDLPNGWRITPAGKAVGEMGDLVMNLLASPDGRVLISSQFDATLENPALARTGSRESLQSG